MSEVLQIRAFDGLKWSEWAYVGATTVTYQIPTVDIFNPAARDIFAPAGVSSPVSSWLRVRDLDGEPITQYQFRNYSTLGQPTGRFVLDGVAQAAGPDEWFTINANQLDSLVFVGGDPAQPFENITVRVSDGRAWSSDLSLFARFPQTLNRAPSAALRNEIVLVAPGQSSAVASWFSASDPDGDDVMLSFSDTFFGNPDISGYFTVNGVRQDLNFTIHASQLGSVQFVAGQVTPAWSMDDITITPSDSALTGAPVNLSVVTIADHLPVVTGSDTAVGLNQSIGISSLFSAYDAVDSNYNYTFFSYVLIDFGDDPGGGYFTVAGVRQNSNEAFSVDVSGVSEVRYVGGSQAGTEMISVRASTYIYYKYYNASESGDPTRYAIRASGDPVRISIRTGNPAVDGAGNDLAGARGVTVGATVSTFTDMVGNADPTDYYRLDVTAPDNLVLGLTNLGGNADFRLLDSNGAVLASSLNSHNTSEAITKTVAAGTYYAVVSSVGGDSTSYKFTALLA